MVSLTALWLPIVLSAVVVFIVSSILHMVLPHHRNDYTKLPDEDKLRDAIRNASVAPGDYAFPCPAGPKDMGSPEMMEKYKQGPVGIMTVMRNGPPAMGKSLAQWFVFSLVISVFVGYVTGLALGPGSDYMLVFRVAGTVAVLGYGATWATDSIWKGVKWSTTMKHLFDGVIYGLFTAGVFGWLWP